MSRRVARVLEFGLGAAAVGYLAVYVAIALLRIRYPFDLEWMEGALIDHVRRIVDGQPIYVGPSLDFIPFLYPPLYYYVSAVVAAVIGIGPVPLRLVSFVCSLGCFVVIAALVRRDTGSAWAGLVAAGLFAATYRAGGAWFDLARVDSLFLLLTLGAVYLLRWGQGMRSWAAAGVLLALAALTKQTAIMIAGPLVLYAVIVDVRRGLALGVSLAVLLGGATLALNAATHGWYWDYTFGLPLRIQDVGTTRPAFWAADLFGPLPIATAMAGAYLLMRIAQKHRPAAFYAVFTAAFVGSAWASRIHAGAYANVLIPAYAALAVVFALALHDLPRLAADEHAPALRTFAAAIGVVQFALLVYSPAAQVPGSRDLARQRELQQRIAAADGDVWLPQHGYFPLLAGKAPHAQGWAITDINRAGRPQERQRLLAELHDALASHRFRLIILDRMDDWLEPDLERYYRRQGPVFDGDGLWTVTGYRTRPRWIYVPKQPAS
jgi:4-amino-4-deoxy-L-arabinose transferase-like glycosyltransferase